MAKTGRNVLATLGLVAVGLPGIRSAAVAAEPALPVKAVTLMVLVDDYADVPPKILEQAREGATRIFQDIHVEIVWLAPGDARLEDPVVLRSAVIVRLVSRDMTDRLQAPDSIWGMATSGGHVATVFYNRIESLSSTPNDKDTGSILGHVIAHEIGHLLLPPNAHSRFGVMQAGLNTQLAEMRSLFFTEGQAHQIRTKLSAP